MLDLDDFVLLVNEAGPRWERNGMSYRLGRSPEERDKPAAWLNVAYGDQELVDLTVWDSGEGELISISASNGYAQTHLEGLTIDSLRQLLDQLITRPDG